jgi:type III restriction enzyme
LTWVKNDHLGFQIPYRKGDVPKSYISDFIIRLNSALNLILEVKGEIGDSELKKGGALRWVDAVNRDGRYGRWVYTIAYHPGDTVEILDRYASAGASQSATHATSNRIVV